MKKLTQTEIKNLYQMVDDDADAEKLGEKIASVLKLRRSLDGDRWATTFGSKTSQGLGRTVVHLITIALA